MKSEVFTQQWREMHAEAGDKALDDAHEAAVSDGNPLVVGTAVQAFASLAQAHYAAANVRAKPDPNRA